MMLIRYLQSKGYGKRNVLLVGYNYEDILSIGNFKYFPKLGYNIQGIITNQVSSFSFPIEINGFFIQKYPLSDFEKIVLEKNIERVFVPTTDIISNGYVNVLDVCRKYNVKLKVLSGKAETILRFSKINDIAGITLYSPPLGKIEFVKRISKRIFDVLFSIIAIVITSPVFLLTSLAIYIESGTPIFFKQKRAAIKGGKTFYFYKFRSMVKNADELKESLLDRNESDGALFKIKNDPRMTKVGKFIRRFSIDELPQLLNVLKGDMSIVGPRPLPIMDFDKLDVPSEYWELIQDREKVKPGITGLWQISGRSKIGFHEMIMLDLYYIENQSLIFDLEILFATVPTVIFGEGAY